MDVSNYQFAAIPGNIVEYVTKKTKSAKSYFRYLLNRTQMMFKYDGMPDSIDVHMFERYLQINGACAIGKAPNGKLYAFNGSVGGRQDVYYRPTKFIVANPHVSQLTPESAWSKEFTIFGDEEHDAVLMRNDLEWMGLTPLISRYSVLMAENCLTVRVATIMLRILALLSAGTDKARRSAEEYLRKLENGELGVIADSFFQETINMQAPPSNNGRYVTQFIELQQYLKGSFYNELGLRANYNMKREAIGLGESTMDADSVLPLCDNMLMVRQEDVKKLNELFDLDIKVDFNSAWLGNYLKSNIATIGEMQEAGIFGVGELGEPGDDGELGENEGLGEPGGDGEREENGGIGENDEPENNDSQAENEHSVNENESTSDTQENTEIESKNGELDGDVEEVEVGKDLTVTEAAVEILNEKVSKLMQEAESGELFEEKGGFENGPLGDEDTQDEGSSSNN